jgi:hypothetical protein
MTKSDRSGGVWRVVDVEGEGTGVFVVVGRGGRGGCAACLHCVLIRSGQPAGRLVSGRRSVGGVTRRVGTRIGRPAWEPGQAPHAAAFMHA